MKKAKYITANRHQRGFTLIELIVGVSILAILLTIAVPSFTNTINTNRTVATTNNLSTALAMARSEALKRGVPIATCASNSTQTACNATTNLNWGNGWIVFMDNVTSNGILDSGEAILKVWTGSGNISVSSTTSSFVRYSASGAPQSAPIVFNILKSGCSGQAARTISINAIGRNQVASTTCP